MKMTRQTKFIDQDTCLYLLDKMIRDSSKGRRLNSDGKKLRDNTIENYIYLKKVLEDFLTEKKFEFKIYIVSHLTAREKEQAKKYYKKFYNEFTDYLYYKKDFFDNYVALLIKGIKTFFNYLSKEHNITVGEYHKQFYTFTEAIDIVVLSPEQMNFLIKNKDLDQQLPPHLLKVKDMFTFGCTVALRYSDLMKLKPDNLHYYNNAYYLKVTSQKTNINTSIKLPDYAVAILKKYHRQQKTLLPVLSNARMNHNLKELATYLNLNEPMPKYRTKRGEKCIVYKNKTRKQHYTMLDHITTHTMRRTAITNMLRLGVPDQVVRKISGHAANSKEFFRYVEFAQSYIDEHTDMVFEKINKISSEKSVFL